MHFVPPPLFFLWFSPVQDGQVRSLRFSLCFQVQPLFRSGVSGVTSVQSPNEVLGTVQVCVCVCVCVACVHLNPPFLMLRMLRCFVALFLSFLKSTPPCAVCLAHRSPTTGER